MAEQWKVVGDFVDFCNCSVPCPCTFAQPPTDDECVGLIAWRVRSGNYGDVGLDGLNVAGVGHFVGNIWEPETKAEGGFVIDESADEGQRQALATIFGGQAGGWPALFAENFERVLGMEFAPIELEIDDDLKTWRVNIPESASGTTELLAGPTTTPGTRLEVRNAPGAEVGPGQGAATYGTCDFTVNMFGFEIERSGRSSKHIPFEWSSEDGF